MGRPAAIPGDRPHQPILTYQTAPGRTAGTVAANDVAFGAGLSFGPASCKAALLEFSPPSGSEDGAQTTAPLSCPRTASPGGHPGPEREGGPAFSRRETGR